MGNGRVADDTRPHCASRIPVHFRHSDHIGVLALCGCLRCSGWARSWSCGRCGFMGQL